MGKRKLWGIRTRSVSEVLQYPSLTPRVGGAFFPICCADPFFSCFSRRVRKNKGKTKKQKRQSKALPHSTKGQQSNLADGHKLMMIHEGMHQVFPGALGGDGRGLTAV